MSNLYGHRVYKEQMTDGRLVDRNCSCYDGMVETLSVKKEPILTKKHAIAFVKEYKKPIFHCTSMRGTQLSNLEKQRREAVCNFLITHFELTEKEIKE